MPKRLLSVDMWGKGPDLEDGYMLASLGVLPQQVGPPTDKANIKSIEPTPAAPSRTRRVSGSATTEQVSQGKPRARGRGRGRGRSRARGRSRGRARAASRKHVTPEEPGKPELNEGAVEEEVEEDDEEEDDDDEAEEEEDSVLHPVDVPEPPTTTKQCTTLYNQKPTTQSPSAAKLHTLPPPASTAGNPPPSVNLHLASAAKVDAVSIPRKAGRPPKSSAKGPVKLTLHSSHFATHGNASQRIDSKPSSSNQGHQTSRASPNPGKSASSLYYRCR